jgi:hypothetical protein
LAWWPLSNLHHARLRSGSSRSPDTRSRSTATAIR